MTFVSEKEAKRVSFIQMLKLMPKFITNKYIRNYCIFLLGKYFFLSCFTATYDFICIEKGYNYDYIIILGTLIIPFILIANVIGSRWLKSGMNQKASVVTATIALVGCIGQYILYKFYYHGPEDDMKLFVGSAVLSMVFAMGAVTVTYDTGFLNGIADPAIGGLYITFIACFINLANILPQTIGTFVIKYLDYDVYMIGCLICAAICMPFAFFYASYIDKVDVLEYRIYTEDNQEQSKKGEDSEVISTNTSKDK